MSVAEAGESLVQQVLNSGKRELRLLAARGLLPLAPEELIPLQVKLARDEDPEIAGRASTVLRLTEPRLLVDYLAVDAGVEELAYFAQEADHPQVLEALLRRRDIPRQLLVTMAPRLDPVLQEILILRQDAIVEEPSILDALESNPSLETYARRRIGEYRQHLLPREQEAPAGALEEEGGAEGEAGGAEGEAGEAEVRSAIIEVSAEPAEGELDETTGLTEGQIRLLPVPVRLRLSRGAARTLRGILVRDINSRVALSVLRNNALGEEEVEQIARSRVVLEEVLEEVARHRDWINRYGILNALVNNPRTPVAIAMRLLPRLGVRDLRAIGRSHNVPDAVKRSARQMYQAKTR